MDNLQLEVLAYEETQRIIEKEFWFLYPGVCEIYAEDIPSSQRDKFYQLVEAELTKKGEKITRYGEFFSIDKFQPKK